MASSSSSSSALSPNAPPFIPPQASVFVSQQPISSQSTAKTLSAKAAPFTKTPNSNSNSDNTHPIESPYYPCYDSSLVGVDGFSSSYFGGDDADDLSCMGMGPWNAPSDEKEENGMQSTWPLPSVDLQGARHKVKITPAKTSGRPKVVISSKKPAPLPSKSTLKTYTDCNENTWYNHKTEKTSSLNSLSEKFIPGQMNTHDLGIKESGNIAKRMGTNVDSSLTKSLKVLTVNTSTAVNEKNDSLDTLMEAHNEDDVELDSPCWKGIQPESPFKKDDPKISNRVEKSEQFNLDGTKDDSFLVTKINGVSSNPGNKVKDKKHMTAAVEDQCRISVEEDKVLQKINVEHSGVETQNDFSFVKSQLIDNTLLLLKKSLTSRAFKKESELNELLHDVLYLADHYPEVNIHNSKKGIANGNEDDYKKESSTNCILDSVEKDENTIPSRQIISTHDMDMHGAMQPIGHYTTHLQDIANGSHYNVMLDVEQPHVFGVKYDAISKSNVTTSYKPDNSSDIDIVKGIIAHDFEAALKKRFCEQEQDLQSLVHNNLWIDAQAKLFSLKYELQLACAEIEILKHNQHPGGRFQEVGMLPGLKSLGNSHASNPFVAAGGSSAREFHPRSASENYISYQGLLA